jgi:hypothetical protein
MMAGDAVWSAALIGADVSAGNTPARIAAIE